MYCRISPRKLAGHIVLTLLSALSTACHNTAAVPATPPARVDTLWYATARQRHSDRLDYRFADSLEFGYYRIASKANVDLTRGSIGLRVIDSARVTRATFLTSIAAPSRDSNDVVVLSVHGYATSHTKAIRDAAEEYLRSGTKARWVAFSWPSSGHGMNLMQPGRAFMTGAYRADSVAAAKSRPAFAQLLLALHATLSGQRLVVTTHSLGAQLAIETLASDSLVREQLQRSPLRAIGLFEPDVSTDRFNEYAAPRLRVIAGRIALYASTNDRMLRFSRLVNHSDRAGLIRTTPAAIAGVEIIDVTDGLSSESWLRRHFGTHHAMRKETSALRDFFDVVVAQKTPACRVAMGTGQQIGNGIWKLLPRSATVAPC